MAVKNWRSRSARMCEMATWTLSMSFMIDDISRPVECASKNSAPCFCTFSKTVLRRFGDRGESDVVDQVVAEIIADALEEEDAEQRDGDHGPDVVDRRRARRCSDRMGGGRWGPCRAERGRRGAGSRTW